MNIVIKHPSSRKFHRTDLILVMLIALVVRIGVGILQSGQPFFQKYITLGRMICDGTMDAPFSSSPVYSVFMSVLLELFGENIDLIRCLQLGMGVLSTVIVTALTMILFGRKCGILAGFLFTCLRPMLVYESDMVTVSLDILLHLIALWFLIADLNNSSIGRVVIGGCFLGLGIGIRPNSMILIPMIALIYLIRREMLPAKLKRCFFFVVSVLLPVFPITYANYRLSGEFIPVTSSGGSVFYSSNNFRATGLGYSPPPALTQIENSYIQSGPIHIPVEHAIFRFLAERAEGHTMGYRDVSAFYSREAWRYLMREPLESIVFWIKKSLYLINQYEVYDTASLVSAENRIRDRFPFFLNFGVLTALGILGICISTRKDLNYYLLLSFLIPHLMTGIGFYVNGRLRISMAPMLAIFAAEAVTRLWEQYRRKDDQIWLNVVFAMGIITLVTYEDDNIKYHRDIQSPAFLCTMKGLAAMHAKDIRGALEHFQKAVVLNPFETSEAHANMAILYNALGEETLAIQEQQKAGGLWPWNELEIIQPRTPLERFQKEMAMALVLWHSGNRPGAVHIFARLHHQFPRNPDPVFNLAIAAYQKQPPDYADALEAVTTALDLGMKLALESTRAHQIRADCLKQLGFFSEETIVRQQIEWEKTRVFP